MTVGDITDGHFYLLRVSCPAYFLGRYGSLYLYRHIEDKKVGETIDFLPNREEAHNRMFRDAFN